MSIIGSFAILAASSAASGFSLMSAGVRGGTVNSFAQIQLAAGTATP